MKKLLSIILSLALIFCFSNTANAITLKDGLGSKILSYNVSNEIIEFAESKLHLHLNSFIRDGIFTGTKADYSLAEPFTIHNASTNTYSISFPVVKNSCIIGLLDISENNGEYSSVFSVSFAQELSNLLSSNINKTYLLLSDGYYIQAFDGTNCVTIYQLYDNGEQPHNLSQDISSNFVFPTKSISYFNLTSAKYAIYSPSEYETLASDGPSSYKTLNVIGVAQDGPNCWAAVCASIINYYKSLSLTVHNVEDYIFPNGDGDGASWTQIKQAYNHWGLYPTQTNVISFTAVKTYINANDPMHLNLTRRDSNNVLRSHGVALIGYEDYRNTSNDKILIIIDPNGARRKTVVLNSSGNFTYSPAGGISYTWSKTRYF